MTLSKELIDINTGKTFMAAMYIIFCVILIVCNIEKVPEAFVTIVKGAFNPKAVTGGVVGSMVIAVQKGVARGIFSRTSV